MFQVRWSLPSSTTPNDRSFRKRTYQAAFDGARTAHRVFDTVACEVKNAKIPAAEAAPTPTVQKPTIPEPTRGRRWVTLKPAEKAEVLEVSESELLRLADLHTELTSSGAESSSDAESDKVSDALTDAAPPRAPALFLPGKSNLCSAPDVPFQLAVPLAMPKATTPNAVGKMKPPGAKKKASSAAAAVNAPAMEAAAASAQTVDDAFNALNVVLQANLNEALASAVTKRPPPLKLERHKKLTPSKRKKGQAPTTPHPADSPPDLFPPLVAGGYSGISLDDVALDASFLQDIDGLCESAAGEPDMLLTDLLTSP